MKKIVSFLLVLIMIFACVPCSMLTASAAAENQWPGTPMTLYDSSQNIYGYQLPEEYNYFIFSDGGYYYGYDNGIAWQTEDIPFTGYNKLYIPNLYDTTYSDLGATYCSVSSSSYPNSSSASKRMVYFKAPSNWKTPSIYCWKSTRYLYVTPDSTPFDLRYDGYSFANSYSAFGYNSFSKIPEDTYCLVYGDAGKQIRKSDSFWGGNCFGMAVTASLFCDGTLDLKDYSSGSWYANSVFTKTKRHFFSGEYYNYIDKDNEIKKLIERFQIWQDSESCNDWKSTNLWEADNVSGKTPYVSSVLQNYDNYYVTIRWMMNGEQVGHAVVIDSSRPPVRLNDDGWYRIYIYDPNNPYYNLFGYNQKSESCYYYAYERYFDVNVKTDQWRIDVGVNSDGGSTRVGYTDNNTYIEGSEIIIRRSTRTLPAVFNGKDKWYYAKDKANTAKLCSENAVVYDADGNVLFKVEDNKTVYVDDSVVVEPRAYALDEDVTASYRIELPVHEFTIEFGSEGTAQVFNENYCYGLVSDSAGSATVTTSDGVTINGDTDSTVDVVVERLEDDDTFTSVNVVVKNDGENSTYISLDENKELTVNNAENSFDALVYSDVQENEYLISNVNTEDVVGENIVDYALNTGELVPNEISGADINYRRQFTYDGAEKTFAPVLKYIDKELVEGVDYTIDGDVRRTEIGSYSVTITGQGNYTGTVTLSYSIVPEFEFAGASLSLGGNVGINYYMKLSDDVIADESAKMEFTLPGGLKNSVPVSSVAQNADGYYVFTCEVAAKYMASPIKAQVIASEDESEIFEYSVLDYAEYVISEAESGNETYTSAAPLVKAMLNYGANAQEHFGYNTENLANDILSDEEKALPEDIDFSDYGYVITDNDNNVDYYGSALSLESETTIKHYFKVENEEEIPDFYVNGELAEVVKKNNLYEVKIKDIPAHRLDSEYVVTAGKLSVNYNALSYAGLAMQSGDETLKDAMKALYAYNIAAKEYIAQ